MQSYLLNQVIFWLMVQLVISLNSIIDDKFFKCFELAKFFTKKNKKLRVNF